jgi:putative ABC transport system permease protein
LERAEDAAARVPSLARIAFTDAWPLQEARRRDVTRDGPPLAAAGDSQSSGGRATAQIVGVTGSYFDLVGIPVRDGRTFDRTDRLGTERVAVVSETLARRLWPNQRALGERVVVVPSPNAPAGTPTLSYSVIGVAGDVRHTHTDEDTSDVYVSLAQYGPGSAFMYVRVDGPAPTFDRDLRAAFASVDPGVVLGDTAPLADVLDRQRASSRFLAELLVVFAAFATVLALVGIYGVISYAARQRRREIAVRLAVGADRAAITTLFLRQGAVTLAIGMTLGLAGAIALGRVLQSQLFRVGATDPLLLSVAAAAFACCGLLAALVPARAAGSTDPAKALLP